jgi:hypothetical protein
LDLLERVRVGEVRSVDVLKVAQYTKVPSSKGKSCFATDDEVSFDDEHDVNRFSSIAPTDEQLLERAFTALVEAYRRFSRPDRPEQLWTAQHWQAVVQVFAKLRTYASIARWDLAPPALHLSCDQSILEETGMDDIQLAGSSVDLAEGVMDTRCIRVATRLAGIGPTASLQQEDVLKGLTPETRSLAQMCLSHFRGCGQALDRMVEEHEPKETVAEALMDPYIALAAALASFRERVSDDVCCMLLLLLLPLWCSGGECGSSIGGGGGNRSSGEP